MISDVRPGDRVQLRPDGEVLTVGTPWRPAVDLLHLYRDGVWQGEVKSALIHFVLPRCPEVGATVGSVEELDALPDGSIVAHEGKSAATKLDDIWWNVVKMRLVGARVLRVGGGT